MNVILRRRFGLDADPWRGLDVPTADAAHVAAALDAALGGAIVSIVAPRGMGKSHALRAALARTDPAVVEPLRLDRDRLRIGDVAVAIVRDLSDERPRGSGEARAGQVRRLLAAASAAGPVVLVIDDAHALHHATVRGLKRLMELGFRGRSPLLGIALVGHADRTAAVPEVGLRSVVAPLRGLTRREAARALASAVGRAADPAALEALAASDRARNWLDLRALVDECLAAAAARGDDRLTAEAAAAVTGGSPPARGPVPVPAPPDEARVAAALAAHR